MKIRPRNHTNASTFSEASGSLACLQLLLLTVISVPQKAPSWDASQLGLAIPRSRTARNCRQLWPGLSHKPTSHLLSILFIFHTALGKQLTSSFYTLAFPLFPAPMRQKIHSLKAHFSRFRDSWFPSVIRLLSYPLMSRGWRANLPACTCTFFVRIFSVTLKL